MTESRSAEHFQRIYRASDDPWGFRDSPYEQEKYARTLAALPARRFTSALEIGCSIGVLTGKLAERCDRILGIDIVAEPLAAARERCSNLPNAQFQQMRVPAEWPDGTFDLFVFSEVLYFLTSDDIAQCVKHIRNTTMPRPTVLLVNWTGQSDDPCTGDEAAEHFIAASRSTLHLELTQRQAGYRLDRLTGA